MPARTSWVRDEAAFLDLAAEWDALVEPGQPFLRHAWFVAWWRAFGAGAELAVATARDGERLVAAFPAVRRRGALEAMANVHTPWFAPVAADDDARRAIVDAAIEAAPSAFHADALVDTSIADDARRHGRLVVVDDRHVSPIVEVAGGWDAYWKANKARLSETARRRRKLHREHEVEEHLVVAPDDLDAVLAEGFALEASGWKGRSGTAILDDERTAGFYRDAAAGYADAGLLRLSYLRVDGDMTAFDLAVLDGGAYLLLKTAYDESLRALAPGMALRLAVVERCFELGVDHDFLGDDMPYKRVFSTTERRHLAVRAFRRAPVGVAGWLWRRRIRPALRDIRHRVRG